jgi:RHS repeat-associated protein
MTDDDEGQLVEAWYNATEPANSGAGNSRYDGFSYDALGNRGQGNYVASRGQMDFTKKDNGLNQYRAWWPYSDTKYDDDLTGWGSPGQANGVLMQDGWITAGFNALNQPMYIWSPTYYGTANWMYFGYDPLGRCVKRWVGESGDIYSNPATYYHYDGSNLLQEGNNAWGPARVYVHGNRIDEIVWSYNTFTGQQAFHHYDARGHCTLLTDSSGNILEQYEYDAFGQPYFYDASGNAIGAYDPVQNLWEGYSQFGNRFLFTGREWIPDLKLYDYRNRMYQPELGRFLQPDPQEFAAGDYNLYRYCHNDPVNNVDPTGLQASGTDEITNTPNLIITGQGDWMRSGSPFTNGDMLSKAKNYLGEVKRDVQKALDKANKASQNVNWCARFSNWLKPQKFFEKNSLATAKTEWSPESKTIMNGDAVGSFDVTLQINVYWNASRSASFTSALETTNMGFLGHTGEIEHTRDAAKALNEPYGGAPAAVDIANAQAASMVGQRIPAETASAQMNAALAPWATLTMQESHQARDIRSSQHRY